MKLNKVKRLSILIAAFFMLAVNSGYSCYWVKEYGCYFPSYPPVYCGLSTPDEVPVYADVTISDITGTYQGEVLASAGLTDYQESSNSEVCNATETWTCFGVENSNQVVNLILDEVAVGAQCYAA